MPKNPFNIADGRSNSREKLDGMGAKKLRVMRLWQAHDWLKGIDNQRLAPWRISAAFLA
jgi:hypothetical protein